MTRLRTPFLIALVVMGLLLSACGGSAVASPAATVNGSEIPDDEFRDTLQLLAENDQFAQGLVQVPVRADGGDASDKVDSSFAAAVLELEIVLELLDQEFQSRGLEVTDEDRDAVRAGFSAELQNYLEELGEDYADGFVEWNAQVQVLRADVASEFEAAEVSDEEVRAYYDDNIDQYQNQACVQHVLVETEAEAEEVLAELEGGADFATVATERSIDPSAASNGGDLGCSSPDLYVEPFADAVTNGEIGEYLGPVETDFGFHVILVTSRGDTTFEDAEADIRAQLEQAASDPSAAFGELIDGLVADADVTISSIYGTWNDEDGRVEPPEGPEVDLVDLG